MKIIFKVFTFVFFSYLCRAQESILVLGNADSVCWDDSFNVNTHLDSSDHLEDYSVIFVFSSAISDLSDSLINQLDSAVFHQGISLYIGAENWPMQAQANALTEQMFQEQFYSVEQTSKSEFELHDVKESVVYFPLSFNFQPILWDQDEPVLQVGTYGKGKVMIDGGYSRFYCGNSDDDSRELFNKLMKMLGKD